MFFLGLERLPLAIRKITRRVVKVLTVFTRIEVPFQHHWGHKAHTQSLQATENLTDPTCRFTYLQISASGWGMREVHPEIDPLWIRRSNCIRLQPYKIFELLTKLPGHLHAVSSFLLCFLAYLLSLLHISASNLHRFPQKQITPSDLLPDKHTY